jgi:calpain-15
MKRIDFQNVIRRGKLFEDPQFPAHMDSILDKSMQHNSRVKKWETLTWLRPRDVYGRGNYALFDSIDPSDIKQGDCGDCYFLSGLASLAESPDRVRSLFLTQELNEAGCYALKFYIGGEPVTVVVDDRFPYCQHKEQWAFTRTSSSNEIWVLLIEKAWAKIFGSYQRIEAGLTGESFPALTGCPAQILMHAGNLS